MTLNPVCLLGLSRCILLPTKHLKYNIRRVKVRNPSGVESLTSTVMAGWGIHGSDGQPPKPKRFICTCQRGFEANCKSPSYWRSERLLLRRPRSALWPFTGCSDMAVVVAPAKLCCAWLHFYLSANSKINESLVRWSTGGLGAIDFWSILFKSEI